MTRRSNRRDFIKQTGAAGLGFWAAGGVALAADSNSPNDKLNFACIGIGGKGYSDSNDVARLGNIVAMCDIDDNTLGKKATRKEFAEAKKYNDFRKMFDEMEKKIDAVTISTPDHTHAVAAMWAIKRGKHVYVQKPLTHSVFEARTLRDAARKHKVATQMGNQGTTENGLRTAVEIIRSGAIGPVREVHVWTNRPIWPQAPKVTTRPKEAQCPKHVHWDLFLGPAPERPYAPGYHPFAWRGWWDFGTGALGDMGCHTANMAFMALKLEHPTTVSAEHGELNTETYPGWAIVHLDFPARGDMPPVKYTWYEGKRGDQKVLPPLELFQGEKINSSGSLLVGDKGILYSPNDYGASYTLLPKKSFEGFKAPAPTLARNGKGDFGQKAEWVAAIKGGPPAFSNFDYASLLTETILLGNVAIRAGKKLEWDGKNLKATNCPEADVFINPPARKGWELT